MNAGDLKGEILGWLRFIKKMEYVCTEVGNWKADCWGVSDTRLIEVETKVTISDLKADFRKPKHRAYAAGAYAPNLFYFAVPENLKDASLALLEKNADLGLVPKYGLLTVRRIEGYLGRQTDVAREASRLHTQAPDDDIRRVAMLRMGSELCGLHQTNVLLRMAFETRFADAIQALQGSAQEMMNRADAARIEQINLRLQQGLPPIPEETDAAV